MTITQNRMNATIARRGTLFALIMAVAGVLPMCAAESQEIARVPLRDLMKTAKGAPLEHIEARVEVVSKQSSPQAGLRLTVVLVNRSGETVRIVDPAELAEVILQDAKGWPVELPRRAPEWLINRAGGPKEPGVIAIPPNGEHRFEIAIREVLPPAKQDGSDAARKPQPIRAGAYTVDVMLTLMGSEVPEGEARAKRTLVSGPVPVHLGK